MAEQSQPDLITRIPYDTYGSDNRGIGNVAPREATRTSSVRRADSGRSLRRGWSRPNRGKRSFVAEPATGHSADKAAVRLKIARVQILCRELPLRDPIEIGHVST